MFEVPFAVVLFREIQQFAQVRRRILLTLAPNKTGQGKNIFPLLCLLLALFSAGCLDVKVLQEEPQLGVLNPVCIIIFSMFD